MTAAAIAAVAIGVPHGGSDLLGPAPASAAVLTLAQKVQAAPPLTGDATLILHTNGTHRRTRHEHHRELHRRGPAP